MTNKKYLDVVSMDESTGQCVRQESAKTKSIFEHEFSVHLRGPLKINKFGVYIPKNTLSKRDTIIKVQGKSLNNPKIKSIKKRIIKHYKLVYVDINGTPISTVNGNTVTETHDVLIGQFTSPPTADYYNIDDNEGLKTIDEFNNELVSSNNNESNNRSVPNNNNALVPNNNNESNNASAPSNDNGSNDASAPSNDNGSNNASAPSNDNGSNNASAPSNDNGSNNASAPSNNNGSNSASAPSNDNGSNDASAPSNDNGSNSALAPSNDNGSNNASAPSNDNGSNNASAPSNDNGSNSASAPSNDNGSVDDNQFISDSEPINDVRSDSESENASGIRWVREYEYINGSGGNIVVFDHLGGQDSGIFSYAFGNSISFQSNSNDNDHTPNPSYDLTLNSNNEVVIMTDQTCDESCEFIRGNIQANKGFPKGEKIMYFELSMPHDTGEPTDINYDMPAVWLLNSKIPRTLQYGNEECSCWLTGCGEIDLLEILYGGSDKLITFMHLGSIEGYLGDSSGTPNYIERPMQPTKYLAFFIDDTVLIAQADVDFQKEFSDDYVQNLYNKLKQNAQSTNSVVNIFK